MSETLNLLAPQTKEDVVVERAPAQAEVTQEDKGRGPKWLPEPIRKSWKWVNDKGEGARKATIMATPAYFVNNSSNFLASAHIVTEMMMFKSGAGKDLITDKSNPVNWIVQPVKELGKDIYSKGKSSDYTLKMLLDGNPVENAGKWLNPHEATLRAIGREEVTAQAKQLKIGSPWQTRTTLTGLIIWTLGAIIPEKKESDQEIERMARMRTLNPVQYIGERLKQAVWFPEWNKHKREMLGLGYLTIGTLSGIGSWFNRAAIIDVPKEFKKDDAYIKNALETFVRDNKAAMSEGKVLAKTIAKDVVLVEKALERGHLLTQRYNFNLGYLFTSAVSFAGGIPLLFALDERKAYSTYGSLSVLRIPALFDSIGTKMKQKEAGWQYYAGSKIAFQVEDAAFSLIGGATKKKRADGTYEIIDHEELKKKAQREAKVEKIKLKDEKLEKEKEKISAEVEPHKPTSVGVVHETAAAVPEMEAANDEQLASVASHDTQKPTTTIGAVREHAMAMPELAAANEQHQLASAV